MDVDKIISRPLVETKCLEVTTIGLAVEAFINIMESIQ